MEDKEQEVAEAIKKPFSIYQDKLRADRHIYYARRENPPCYVKVVVELNQDCAQVITAFLTDSGKLGEIWIWPQSSD